MRSDIESSSRRAVCRHFRGLDRAARSSPRRADRAPYRLLQRRLFQPRRLSRRATAVAQRHHLFGECGQRLAQDEQRSDSSVKMFGHVTALARSRLRPSSTDARPPSTRAVGGDNGRGRSSLGIPARVTGAKPSASADSALPSCTWRNRGPQPVHQSGRGRSATARRRLTRALPAPLHSSSELGATVGDGRAQIRPPRQHRRRASWHGGQALASPAGLDMQMGWVARWNRPGISRSVAPEQG